MQTNGKKRIFCENVHEHQQQQESEAGNSEQAIDRNLQQVCCWCSRNQEESVWPAPFILEQMEETEQHVSIVYLVLVLIRGTGIKAAPAPTLYSLTRSS
jgi:hypothetical protein